MTPSVGEGIGSGHSALLQEGIWNVWPPAGNVGKAPGVGIPILVLFYF